MAKNKIPFYPQTPKFGQASNTNSLALGLTTLLTAGADGMKLKVLNGSLNVLNDKFSSAGDAVTFEVYLNDGGGDDLIFRAIVSNKVTTIEKTESGTDSIASMDAHHGLYYDNPNDMGPFVTTIARDNTDTINSGLGLKHGSIDLLELMTGCKGIGLNLPGGTILKAKTVLTGSPNQLSSAIFAVGEDY